MSFKASSPDHPSPTGWSRLPLFVGLLALTLLAAYGPGVVVPSGAQQPSTDGSGESVEARRGDHARKEAVGYLQREAGYSEAAANRFIDQQHEQLTVLATMHDDLEGIVGGAYFDHEREGILVVRVPDGQIGTVASALASRLTEVAGLEGRIELAPAKASLETMTEANDRLIDQFVTALDGDWAVGYDPRSDQVTVMVPTENVTYALDVAAEITASLSLPANAVALTASDEPIITGDDACSSSKACDPPARGGLRFQKCSSGFMADNTGGSYYTITAGHCGSGSYYHKAPGGRIINGKTCAIWSSTHGCKVGGAPLSGVFTPSGVASYTGETVNQNSRVDAARVFVSSTDLSYWGPKNRNVYLYSNVNYFSVTNKWWNPAALPANTFVHRGGGESGTTTGFVHLATHTYTAGGVTFRDMLLSTYARGTGDSGSPVVVRYAQSVGGVNIPAATGIAIHGGSVTISGTAYARASHVRFVEQALQVHLRDATAVGH